MNLVCIVVVNRAKHGHRASKETGVLCSVAHTITNDLLVRELGLRVRIRDRAVDHMMNHELIFLTNLGCQLNKRIRYIAFINTKRNVAGLIVQCGLVQKLSDLGRL